MEELRKPIIHAEIRFVSEIMCMKKLLHDEKMTKDERSRKDWSLNKSLVGVHESVLVVSSRV